MNDVPPSPAPSPVASTEETIAAAASAAAGGARGIVRITGPAAIACVRAFVWVADDGAWPTSAAAVCPGELRLPEFHSPVPCDLFVWPNERSYTRQPTIELHLPGSPPIVEAALAAACRHGARPAKPGEFTLRAFLAGRLDLTQAEAVLGVVDAVDRRQLDAALKQMAGGLAAPLDRLRNQLLDLTVHVEAGLDFIEEDISFITRAALLRQLHELGDGVGRLLAQMTDRTDAAEVPRVVLVGLPNVGKSSLFNALGRSEQAIVSAISGTTRDYLARRLALDGIVCELIDTAGVEAALPTSPGAGAQVVGAEQAAAADLRLLCLDASRPLDPWESAALVADDAERIVVRTKADLAPSDADAQGLRVSAATGEGLDRLRVAIAAALGTAGRDSATDVVGATAVRCRDSLRRAREALEEAAALVDRRGGEELVAVELRLALDELGQVVGKVYTDDILDRIFSRFCIGK